MAELTQSLLRGILLLGKHQAPCVSASIKIQAISGFAVRKSKDWSIAACLFGHVEYMVAFTVPGQKRASDCPRLSQSPPNVPISVRKSFNHVPWQNKVRVVFNQFSTVTCEPQKLLMALLFSGWGYNLNAWVLCSWVWMLSMSMSKPQKLTFWQALAHFACLALRPCSVSKVSTSRTCMMCYTGVQLRITISLRYTTLNLRCIGSKCCSVCALTGWVHSPGLTAGLATRTSPIWWWRPSFASSLWQCIFDGKQPPSSILLTSRSCACSWVSPQYVWKDNDPWQLWHLLHDYQCTYAVYCKDFECIILLSRKCLARAETNCSKSSHLSGTEAPLLDPERCDTVRGLVSCHSGQA